MKKILTIVSLFAVIATVALVASSTSANNGGVDARIKVRVGANASTTASSTIRKAVKLDATTASLQLRANKEIDRRIESLTNLQTKISSFKKLSLAKKSEFLTTIQSQITLLGNLKIKVNADTDITTLKADVESITRAYRIYALILPQLNIIAAADRIATTTSLLSTLSVKLQTRVTAIETSGKDIASLQALLLDMKAKIIDANAKADAVISVIINLKPDNGDKTIMASNNAALKTARTDLKTATQDVKDAKKDSEKIMSALKISVKGDASATTTEKMKAKKGQN